MVHGETSISSLPNFMAALQKWNPCHCGVATHPSGGRRPGLEMIHLFFLAFKPCVEGFRHCRRVICVDATHLYTKYKHKLMIAVCVDGNQTILHLAFALVDEESIRTWSWFLNLLRQHIIADSHDFVAIILDRNKGIIQAVHKGCGLFNGECGCHRFCLRHMCSYVNARFRNPILKDLCWVTGVAVDEVGFRDAFEQIETINP